MTTTRSRTNMAAKAASKAVALNFDPRYVEFLVQAWLARDLASVDLDDLVAVTARRADDAFTALNAMGLREEAVSLDEIKRAIVLLKSLGLLKQKRITPKAPKQPKRGASTEAQMAQVAVAPPYTEVSVTPEGRDLLTQPQAIGGLRPGLVRRVVAYSPDLTALLQALRENGPLIEPVRHLTALAPTRGAPYTRAIEEGLHAFRARVGLPASPDSNGKRPTAAKLIDTAKEIAFKRHPAGSLKQLDKLVTVASGLGLVWTDTTQINEVIAARSTGSAAVPTETGYAPHVPQWDDLKQHFIDALVHAQGALADGTGFVAIGPLRGALGRAFQVSAPVVDTLLCQARAQGDQGRSAVTLHFEPDEDAMYASTRQPLIWNGRAYDQVLVTVPSKVPLTSAAVRRVRN